MTVLIVDAVLWRRKCWLATAVDRRRSLGYNRPMPDANFLQVLQQFKVTWYVSNDGRDEMSLVVTGSDEVTSLVGMLVRGGDFTDIHVKRQS
jgi:hypothetical protein